MKIQIMAVYLMLMTLLITGCGSMNSSYDCPNKAGVSCKSLDQINGMVDSGQITGKGDDVLLGANARNADFEPFTSLASYTPGQPLRYGETVQRIWMAPYEDREGNYHQDSAMYVIVKGGHWIGSPVKSIQAV